MSKRQRPSWECSSVERVFHKTREAEMRQRLAEVAHILLKDKNQLQKPAFFSDHEVSHLPESHFALKGESA